MATANQRGVTLPSRSTCCLGDLVKIGCSICSVLTLGVPDPVLGVQLMIRRPEQMEHPHRPVGRT